MEVQVLGPVGVHADGVSVQLGAPKERAVLAVLALAGDAVVSEGTLIDAIWGDDPPRTAAKVLQNLVLKVRKPFRTEGLPDPIATQPGGYQLALGAAAVDVHRVDALKMRARQLAKSNPAQAAELYREALDAWRGEALADLGDLPFVAVEAPRLAELRLALLEERLEMDLELGRHADVVTELEGLCSAWPLRERFAAQRMTALYRCGRQAEALRAFQTTRSVLADELGLDPGPRLVELERAIAADDRSLLHEEAPWPSGTVSFLFTDIEASTVILGRSGDSYRSALEDHNRLLRAAWTTHRGIEVHTAGDAFFVAFQDAADALSAAVHAQRSLAAHPWPDGAELRVRMGIHTGEAQPVGRDYVAMAVHQAARVANAAHGGQLVVSDATMAALAAAGGVPADLGTIDLGLHEVRDFPGPVRLHQVQEAGRATAFPPVRTLGFLSSNLPQARTSFVGRVEDQAEVVGLLGRTRVVTLLGPGGVGKTRLAVELGRGQLGEHPDGVFMADLAPVSDAAGVARALAEALAVQEQDDQPIVETLLTSLRVKHTLLLLDNCEHVIDDAAELVERITGSCADVVVLATSREALRVEGEAIWRLSPLRVPSLDPATPLEELVGVEAVQLFAERVQLVQPGFVLDDATARLVAQVVAELDGIPLAIELAAAAAGQLTIDDLVAGLEDRFELLTGGRRTAPARQQTLWAVVDWSFGLLGPDEQTLLRRLAVFSGTFGAEAVDAVASPPRGALDRLVSASVVSPESSLDATEPARFRLLETVKAYARAKLDEAGETDEVRNAHLDWAAALTREADAHMRGPEAPRALRMFERDHDNLRAALAWGIEGGRPGTSMAMAAILTDFWDARGHRIEGVRWLQDAIAAGDDSVDPVVRVKALNGLAGISGTSHVQLAEDTYHECIALADEIGDHVGRGNARMGLGLLLNTKARLDEALGYLEEALVIIREHGDDHSLALVLERLSEVVHNRGDEERHRVLKDEAIELQRRLGDRRELFWSLASDAQYAILTGNRARALAGLAETRELIDILDYLDGDAWISCCEGMFSLADGDVDRATERFDHALQLVRATQELLIIEWAAAGVAWLAMHRGDLTLARSVLVEQNEVGVMGGVPRTRWYRSLHAGTVAAVGGALDIAVQLVAAGEAVCPEVLPAPAGQDAVDVVWLREHLTRELGAAWGEATADAARALAAGGDPCRAAFDAFEAWTPPSATALEGPPIWHPW